MVFNVVPVALALVGVAIILLAAASLAVGVFQSIVALALSLVAFIHAYEPSMEMTAMTLRRGEKVELSRYWSIPNSKERVRKGKSA